MDLDTLHGLEILTAPVPLCDLDLQAVVTAAAGLPPSSSHDEQGIHDEAGIRTLTLRAQRPGTVHALLVWWDVHLDKDTICTSGPAGVGLTAGTRRVQSWRPLLVSLPCAVPLAAAGSSALVQVVIGNKGLQVVPPKGGPADARPMWAVEDANNVHVQRAHYCDLLVRRVENSSVWHMYSQQGLCVLSQDGELVMRSRGGGRPPEASVEHVLLEMQSQCGALRLHPTVVAQQLQRLTVLEVMASQQEEGSGLELY